MSNSLPSSIKPSTRVLTYVFKEGSPNIQVLLNFLKNKKNTLVKVFTDKNGYTTVTATKYVTADCYCYDNKQNCQTCTFSNLINQGASDFVNLF